MYSAIFSLRLLCAIYIGSVVGSTFVRRRYRFSRKKETDGPTPGNKTVRTTFPTRKNEPDKSDGGPVSAPNRQDSPNDSPDRTKRTGQVRRRLHPTDAPPPLFRSDETVRTTGSNRSNGPDRLNERSAPTDESSGSGRTKQHGASSPPRHLPFHQPPKEPAGASFPRISRSLGTADGFPELSQPARHTNIPRLTSTTSIPAATNAAPQTTTKCGWPVRIHRDTGPVALCPKYGNRTVRYRIT